MSDHRLGELYALVVNYQRERDEARAAVERWRQTCVAMAAEVERLRALLREVAGSGVQLPAEPPGLPYTTVQIDGELWERLRKEFGQ